jgi:hypothetical protein
VPFYTYDGYLEENDRHKIRAERRSLEQLRVTGGALFGFLAFVVSSITIRELADSPSPSSHSEESMYPSQDSFLEWLEPSLAMTSSPFMEAAD